jgi:hypothetical protein
MTVRPQVLAALRCPVCRAEIPGVLSSEPRAPSTFDDCLRKCSCGAGAYSNGRTPTWIFKDPLDNVPAEVRAGLIETAGRSINVRNRTTKLFRLGFASSEDAVTWTVFRYLAQMRTLRERLAACGNPVARQARDEPAMLLWGCPVPREDCTASAVADSLLHVVGKVLKEPKASYSEPDVVLDFDDAGVVIVEAKYKSGNDRKSFDYSGWSRYLSAVSFSDAESVRRSGMYELARNWRILDELAGGRKASLVNLGLSIEGLESQRLATFRASLRTTPRRDFRVMTWESLVGEVPRLPEWLQRWLASSFSASSKPAASWRSR